jgi:hypothetical protein
MTRAEPGWSVRLLLDEEESVALSHPDTWPIDHSVERMIIGGFAGDEVEGSPFVTIELRAPSANTAEELAQQLVRASVEEAGRGRVRPVVWVAPLGDEPDGHRFLEQAKFLFGSEQFDLAIVAAQIHFELQLRLLLERAAVRADNRWACRLTKNRRVTALGNDVSQASVQLLLGVDVTESQFWPGFKAHLQRRNLVAHEGASMGSNEASASIKVVQALWAQLAEAERSWRLFET